MNQLQATSRSIYKVGGSLPLDFAAYVKRQADEDLYQLLKERKFCYVLNSRQMGKSSLRVRIMNRLQGEGISCCAIDLTEIGSSDITRDEWYAGIIDSLINDFSLDDFDLEKWWNHFKLLSPAQKLGKFFGDILLKQVNKPIVIFVDEIDSTLKLPFKDDFFALLRACYNLRADNGDYNRLTFCLLGVASPRDLIANKQSTPFNIGEQIDLKGFERDEVEPLVKGLEGKVDEPDKVMDEILYWTSGQPFLTQRLCHLLIRQTEPISNLQGLVKEEVIEQWETKDEQKHFSTIRDRILDNNQKASYLLELYRKVLQEQDINLAIPEIAELQLTGLVVKRQNTLDVYNPIYREIFNERWIDTCLNKLRPYQENFRAWIDSGGQDESRLLSGQALTEAEEWSKDKSIGFQDRRFLEESFKKESKDKAIKESNEILEKANKDLKQANRKAKHLIRIGIIVLGLALSGAAICGVWGFLEGQKATEAIKEASDAKEQAKEQRTLANQAKGEVQQQQLTLKSTTQNLKELNQRFQGVETQRKTAETRYKAAQTQVQQAQIQLTLAQNQQRKAQETARSAGIKSQKAQAEVLVAQNQLNQSKINLDTAEKAKKEAETAAQKARGDKEQADLVYANINKEIKTAQNLGQLAGELQDKGKTDDSNEALRQAGLSFKVTDHNLKQALLLAGTSQAYLSLENQKEAQKSIAESQTSLAKAVKDNKTSEQVTVLVYSTQGQLSEAQKKIKEAITSYQKAFVTLKASQYDPYSPNISPKILSEEQVETVHRKLLELLGNGQTQDNLKSKVEQSFKNHYVAKETQNIKELETLLKNKNWKEADQKTFNALLSSAYSKDVGGFYWSNVSCPALRQIDQLWVDNSKGVYGFSVQLDIYKKTGNPIGGYNEEAYRRFGQEVGWNVDNTWLNYKDLSWGEPKIKGHLPVTAVRGWYRDDMEGTAGSFLALRLVNCSI